MSTPLTFTIPDGLPLVGAGLVSTIGLLGFQTITVLKARKAAKIPYPQLYAEKAEQEASAEAKIFNCAQRAHQNTLESLPIVLMSTALGATKYPKVIAGLLGTWVVSRFIYTIGYSTGNPERRRISVFLGIPSYLSKNGSRIILTLSLGLIAMGGVVAIQSFVTYLGF